MLEKRNPQALKTHLRACCLDFLTYKKKQTIQWVSRISFGLKPTAAIVKTANVTAAAPFMELLIALFPRARLCELRSGGRCECVSPFPSNRLSDWAYHGSRRGWPLTWIVTPGIAALTGGGSCHPDTPRLTPPPHSTRTQKHTCHRQCIPSEATHERQTRKRQTKNGKSTDYQYLRLCHLFLSTIHHTGSQCPDTILFLQMSAVMLELISCGLGGNWTLNTL